METFAAHRRKVVHLTSVHSPTDTRIVHKECATLAAAGYDVTIVAPGQARLPSGVRLHSIPVPRNRFERMTRTMWHVYRAARKERGDVYHFHDPELMGVGLALRASGARVVFDVHEDVPGDIADKPWIPPWLRRPIALAATVSLKMLERAFSGIVAATPAIATGFSEDRTIVVCNYPRLEEFTAVSGENFTNRASSALYHGDITELRCIEEIVRSFSSPEMRDGIRLTLAGPFEDEQFHARLKQLPGWNRVDYLGIRPRSEIPQILANARVGLVIIRPARNRENALPTKLFEFMAAGLPVVISDTLSFSTMVRDLGCGFVVNPLDVDAIARAITEIVANPEQAQAMGARGRQLVQERYQWNNEAKKLQQLYATLA